MLTTILKIIMAHLLGDFVLQSKQWVEKRNTKIQYLFYHIAVHAGLLILFFINDLGNNWQNILFLAVAHLAIDSLKIGWQVKFKSNPVILFFVDQALHLLSILALTFFKFKQEYISYLQYFNINHLYLYLIALVLIIFVIPIVIRVFFSKWSTDHTFENKHNDTLFDAGKIIGILERALILGFVLLNFIEGIGFLLAAKSIFRFGDLRDAKDNKFTEYVLIGTLLSFGLGMLVAFTLKSILHLI